MVKLGSFLGLIVFLLSIGFFNGVMLRKVPTSIGNYEYPYGVYIPRNFTIPAGNVFKFKLYSGGFFWYKCNCASNWSLGSEITIRSTIPNDTSTMTVTEIGTAPSLDPTKNSVYELIFVNKTSGKGAFSDLTYAILTDVKGGAAPPSTECKLKELRIILGIIIILFTTSYDILQLL
ncbi:4775_t:CDS:2, partial [Cetraspora pellucida]